MNIDEHVLGLGRLWSNFLSFDAILRVTLSRLSGVRPSGLPYRTDLYSLPVGTELPEGSIANMKFFSTLVGDYNEEVTTRSLGEPIDSSLVELRNAIAHGFVTTSADKSVMRLLKFARSKPGFVKITTSETMDAAWFKTQTRRVYDAMCSVKTVLDKLPMPCPPMKTA
jgi:hypothetical protein